MNPAQSFDKLQISDLKLLLQLPLFKSVNALALSTQTDVANMNRKLARIEEALGCKLIERTKFGYTLPEESRKILENLSTGLEYLEGTRKLSFSVSAPKERRLRLTGRGFLVEWMIDSLFLSLTRQDQTRHFDFMDSSPETAEQWAKLDLIDLLLSLGDVGLGEDWVSEKVGSFRWHFIVRKEHPLLKRRGEGTIKKSDLSEFPTVGFSYVEGGLLYRKPLIAAGRYLTQQGSNAQSARMTLLMVEHSDHIGYVPELLLREQHNKNYLVSLPIDDEVAMQDVFVHAHKDRVVSRDLQELISLLKNHLDP